MNNGGNLVQDVANVVGDAVDAATDFAVEAFRRVSGF